MAALAISDEFASANAYVSCRRKRGIHDSQPVFVDTGLRRYDTLK